VDKKRISYTIKLKWYFKIYAKPMRLIDCMQTGGKMAVKSTSQGNCGKEEESGMAQDLLNKKYPTG
jgi:hypothetical protein